VSTRRSPPTQPGQPVSDVAHLGVLTVRTPIQRSLAKLGARDPAQLAVMAYQTGLLRQESPRL